MDRTGGVMDKIDRFLERLTDDQRNLRAVGRGGVRHNADYERGNGMSKQIDEGQLQTLGMLADKADNYLAWATNPMSSADLRVDAMKTGLTELSKELKELYVELAGDNPWQVWRDAG